MGAYDGRVTARDTGIASSLHGSNDPALMAVSGVYTAMWHVYLNDELKYTSTSPFLAQNDKVGPNWDWSHIDPTRTKNSDNLYAAGDLAAAMEVNPYLKVFSASGYYDSVTGFFQTFINFQNMPLGSESARENALNNIKSYNYESGHMIYLDDNSRVKMKEHLTKFYEDAIPKPQIAAQRAQEGFYTSQKRRSNRTPY